MDTDKNSNSDVRFLCGSCADLTVNLRNPTALEEDFGGQARKSSLHGIACGSSALTMPAQGPKPPSFQSIAENIAGRYGGIDDGNNTVHWKKFLISMTYPRIFLAEKSLKTRHPA